ncbi:hypothetical protein HaLaN_03155, partial [Haematococcus lacustris]
MAGSWLGAALPARGTPACIQLSTPAAASAAAAAMAAALRAARGCALRCCHSCNAEAISSSSSCSCCCCGCTASLAIQPDPTIWCSAWGLAKRQSRLGDRPPDRADPAG